MDLTNVFATKIPMNWVTAKDGSKIKFLEFKSTAGKGGIIYYGLKQGNRPTEYELSNNFDLAMIKAIKAVGGIKTNIILVKGITTKYNGKQWIKVQPNAEIIVIDARTKTPKFRETVLGADAPKETANELRDMIRTEISSVLKEFNGGNILQFADPTMPSTPQDEPRVQHFYNKEKWRVIAMQIGAVIIDRGDDLKATMPDGTRIGIFDKMLNIGTLSI